MRFVKNEEYLLLMKEFSTTCRNSSTDYKQDVEVIM